MICHPERSEGSAFRRKIPIRNGPLAGGGRRSRFDEFDFARMFGLDAAYFVGSLQVQPELFGRPEEAGQTNSCIGADATPLENDVVDPGRGHAQPLCQFVSGYAHRLQELLTQDFAGMNSPVWYAFSDNAHANWPQW